jgi:hypothetical protein
LTSARAPTHARSLTTISSTARFTRGSIATSAAAHNEN